MKCEACGWEGEDEETIDHFCPECGHPTNYYDDESEEMLE